MSVANAAAVTEGGAVVELTLGEAVAAKSPPEQVNRSGAPLLEFNAFVDNELVDNECVELVRFNRLVE